MASTWHQLNYPEKSAEYLEEGNLQPRALQSQDVLGPQAHPSNFSQLMSSIGFKQNYQLNHQCLNQIYPASAYKASYYPGSATLSGRERRQGKGPLGPVAAARSSVPHLASDSTRTRPTGAPQGQPGASGQSPAQRLRVKGVGKRSGVFPSSSANDMTGPLHPEASAVTIHLKAAAGGAKAREGRGRGQAQNGAPPYGDVTDASAPALLPPHNHDLSSILSTAKHLTQNSSLENTGGRPLVKSQTLLLGSGLHDPATIDAESSDNTLKGQSLEVLRAPDVEVRVESPGALPDRGRGAGLRSSSQQQVAPDHLRTINLEGGYAFAPRGPHNSSCA